MRACELTKDGVKFVIPHQVNLRIIDSAMEKLGMPPEQAYVNIAKYGNTSAASVPPTDDSGDTCSTTVPAAVPGR